MSYLRPYITRFAARAPLFIALLTTFTVAAHAAPTIYLTPIQCAGLEDRGNDDQWPAVRNYLHGLWFNNAGNSNQEITNIVLGLNKKNYPVLVPVGLFVDANGGVTYKTPAWTKLQDVNLLLGGAKTLQAKGVMFDTLDVVDGDSQANLAQGVAAIRALRADPQFANVFTGATFSPRHGLNNPSQVANQTYFFRAKALINEINGMVAIESAPERINNLPGARTGFINLYTYAKSRGLKFTWLMNRGVGTNNAQWISDIQTALNSLAGSNVFPDVIAISNQGDNARPLLPALPETNANGAATNTITGSLFWLLGNYGWITPPVPANQSVVLAANTTKDLVLSASGVNLTYSVLTGPAHGNLVALEPATGEVTYVPATNYFGADNFTFKADDGFLSATGTVSLQITPAPVSIKLQTGTALDPLMDTYLNYQSTTIDSTGTTGSITYLLGGSQFLGKATKLKLDFVSGSGRTLRFGGLNGVAVSGGADNAWWDSNENLTITLSLLDASSNNVTSSYAIDLIGAALRWNGANGSQASFNSQTVSATTATNAFQELALNKGQTNETILQANRLNQATVSQLAGLIYLITPH